MMGDDIIWMKERIKNENNNNDEPGSSIHQLRERLIIWININNDNRLTHTITIAIAIAITITINSKLNILRYGIY